MGLGTLLIVVLVLAIVGFVVWLITSKIPMDPTFKLVIYVVVVIVLVLWLMNQFGVIDSLNHLGRTR
jgi:hypothetical protein